MKRDLPYLLLIVALAGVLAWMVLRHDPSTDLLRDAARELNQQTVIIHHLDSTNAVLVRQTRHLDSVQAAQKLAYAPVDSAYKHARPITVHDTVYVPKAAADAAVNGCQLLLLTCDQRAALAELRIQNRDSVTTATIKERDAYKMTADGVAVHARKERWQWGLEGYAAGAMSCTLLSFFHH